jgi:hypothetical protein
MMPPDDIRTIALRFCGKPVDLIGKFHKFIKIDDCHPFIFALMPQPHIEDGGAAVEAIEDGQVGT